MNSIKKTNLHIKLKNLRINAGLTQEKLAKKLFISRSCWSNYETGIRMPTIEMMGKIADYFNVGINYFLNDTSDIESFAGLCSNDINQAIDYEGYLDLSKLRSESRTTVIEVYRCLRIKEKVIKEQSLKNGLKYHKSS